MSSSAYASWNTDGRRRCGSHPPKRALEIVGVIAAFIFAWPLAVAYIVWKCLGYPVPKGLKEAYDRNFTSFSFGSSWGNAAGGFGSGYRATGNAAFDDYRRSEIERLEAERRRLDEEARAFAEFVEELKRAKDREEFDAFMRRRRAAGPVDI